MIIMISAANADVCLSMARILKSHASYKQACLIGLTPDAPWPARHYFDKILTIPMVSDPNYGSALTSTIEKAKPDIFIPFSEAELSWFAENPGKISCNGTKIIINPPDVLNNFLDKKKTADFLSSVGVNVPATFESKDIQPKNFPIIMKPRRSAGSKNMAIIRNASQWDGFKQVHAVDLNKYVGQEFIDTPDDEFTCAVWRMGKILRYCALRRRLQGGMTGFARLEQHAAIDQTLEKIANALTGDIFINVQLRLRSGIPYVFEINPRFSSTVMMRHKLGFQDLIWTLDPKIGVEQAPRWQPPIGAEIFRVSEECVVQEKAS